MARALMLFLALGGAVILSGCATEEKSDPLSTKDDNLSFFAEQEAQKKMAEEKAAKDKEKAAAKKVMNKPMYQSVPEMQIDAEKKYSAILVTSAGNITVSLNAKATPQTVNNFVFLAREKFYDGTIFHRTIKGFMIQGGDPRGDGTGGPGYKFPDEAFSGSYTRGTLAMANSGPDTNGSQFFIMHQDGSLPQDYVIFGNVTEGLDVVDKIATAPVKSNAYGEASTPENPVTIQSITVVEE